MSRARLAQNRQPRKCAMASPVQTTAARMTVNANHRLQALLEIGGLVSASLQPQRIFDATAQAMVRLLDVKDVGVWTYESSQEVLRLEAMAPASGQQAGRTLPVEGTISGLALRSGKAMVVPRLRQHPFWTRIVERLDSLESGLFVPVLAQDRPLGVLVAFSQKVQAFDAEDVQLAQALASHVAVAIQNAQLHQALEARMARVQTLVHLNQLISSSLSLGAVLAEIARAAAVALVAGAPHISFWIADTAAGTLTVGASSDESIGADFPRRTTHFGHGGVGWVAVHRRPLNIPDVFADERSFVTSWWRTHGFRSLYAMPIVRGDTLLAVLAMSGREPFHFGPEDEVLLGSFGAQAGIAIENARLFERERRRRRQLEAIGHVTADLTRELDLVPLLALIGRRAIELVGAKHCTIYLWDEDQELLVSRAFAGQRDWSADLRWRLGQGVSGAAAQQRKALIVNDYRTSTHARPIPMDRSDTTAVLAAPAIYQDRLLGVITVTNEDDTERLFTEEDLELLKVFADQAAIAIENARLFEQAGTVEALREVARLKTEFLSTVSHELRTPLSLIHGFAELLVHRGGHLSEHERATMASEIHAGSTVMTRLVDDLLDFSRLEQERFTLQRRVVNASETLEALVDAFRLQPGGERIVIDVHDELPILVDPQRFSQIVSNLLANALHYAPNGPITVRAEQWKRNWLRLEVVDRGPGIPPDEQPRVWEKFYRGSLPIHSTTRGSGLGLAVVKSLVELHGGQVGLESTPGQRSIFWITVPLAPLTP